MWISLIFIVLLFAIVFFQATQGMFSALIMAVLTICCAAFALGTYEWVATEHLAKYWQPDFAHAISLAVLFGVPLLILRVVFDKVVKRACLLPAMIDRVGGAVCGLVTGLVMAGVAAIAVQMIPVGTSMLGFSRFDLTSRDKIVFGSEMRPPPNLEAPDRGLWLGPDRLAAGTMSLVSQGVFSGKVPFRTHHPNLVQAVGWVNTANNALSRYAPPNSIKVVSTTPLEVLFCLIPGNKRNNVPEQYEPVKTKPGRELHVVRVDLLPEAFDRNKSHVFVLRQFRLVGTNGDTTVQYFPIATQQADELQSINRYVSASRVDTADWPIVDDPISPRKDNGSQVDLVFEVPSGFTPVFIEYKRNARAAVKFGGNQTAGNQPTTAAPAGTRATPSGTPAPGDAPTSSRPGRRPRRSRGTEPESRGGRIRAFASISGKSFFGDQLPFELKSYRGLKNAEMSNGALIGGHLVADAEQPETGTAQPVSKLRVPEDKRLLHLNVGKLGARSGLGKILSQAITAVQNYVVTDSNGKPYKIIGKYALAKVNDKDVFEIQYFPDQVGTVGGLGKFNRIKESDLKKDDAIVFLFLIDPGAQIASFTTGGAASRAEDLSLDNLVAPN